MVAPETVKVNELFKQRFGGDVTCFGIAPGTLKLMQASASEHSASTLSIAVDQKATVAVSLSADRLIHGATTLCSGKASVAVGETVNTRLHGWLALPLSVSEAIAEQYPDVKRRGFNVAVHSEIAAGSGMASAAAIEVAIAFALNKLYNLRLNTTDLVRISHHAGTIARGSSARREDYFSSIHGEQGTAIFSQSIDQKIYHIPFDLDSNGLTLLVVEDAPHRGEPTQYALEHKANLSQLEVAPEVQFRARYLRQENYVVDRTNSDLPLNTLVNRGLEALRNSDFARFGRLMTANNEGLNNRVEIGSVQKAVVDAAKRSGAIGAFTSGNGGRRQALLLTWSTHVERVVDEARQVYATQGWGEPHCYALRTSNGATSTLNAALEAGQSSALKPPTLHDVAKRAGVSYQTVSRTINHPDAVAISTQLRVEQAILELGFQPNGHARALRLHRVASHQL